MSQEAVTSGSHKAANVMQFDDCLQATGPKVGGMKALMQRLKRDSSQKEPASSECTPESKREQIEEIPLHARSVQLVDDRFRRPGAESLRVQITPESHQEAARHAVTYERASPVPRTFSSQASLGDIRTPVRPRSAARQSQTRSPFFRGASSDQIQRRPSTPTQHSPQFSRAQSAAEWRPERASSATPSRLGLKTPLSRTTSAHSVRSRISRSSSTPCSPGLLKFATKKDVEAVMSCLRSSQLFKSFFFDDRFVGQAKLPASVFVTPSGELEVRLEDAEGDAIVGVDCKRSNLTVRWEKTGDNLRFEVVKAAHLPKMDRFGLCDSQIHVEVGLQEWKGKVRRDCLDPIFHQKFSLLSSQVSEVGITVRIYHIDISDTLAGLGEECELMEVEAQSILIQAKERAEKMFILVSGSLNIFEERKNPRPQYDPTVQRTGMEIHPEPEMVQVGKLSTPGACLGEGAVLTGENPPLTIGAATNATVVRISIESMSALLTRIPNLCERLAHTIIAQKESVEDRKAQDMGLQVHVYGIHSLPEDVDLEFAESDLTCYLELEGQRRSTHSRRFIRKKGEDPYWNESFKFEGIKSKESNLHISVWDVGFEGGFERIVGKIDIPMSELLLKRHSFRDYELENPEQAKIKDKSKQTQMQKDLQGLTKAPALNTAAARRLNLLHDRGMTAYEAHVMLVTDPSVSAHAPFKHMASDADFNLMAGFRRKQRQEQTSDDSDSDSEAPQDAHKSRFSLTRSMSRSASEFKRRTEGGVITVEMRVSGKYYEGERDVLNALSIMGFEGHYYMFKKAGFTDIGEFLHGIDEASLVRNCPDMKKAVRRKFLRRLEECRQHGFLNAEARELSRHIRHKHGIRPKEIHSTHHDENVS